jgi:hypothetical protein
MPAQSPLLEFPCAPGDRCQPTYIGRTIPQNPAIRAGICVQFGTSTQKRRPPSRSTILRTSRLLASALRSAREAPTGRLQPSGGELRPRRSMRCRPARSPSPARQPSTARSAAARRVGLPEVRRVRACYHPRRFYSYRSTIRRPGRALTPSMPVSGCEVSRTQR